MNTIFVKLLGQFEWVNDWNTVLFRGRMNYNNNLNRLSESWNKVEQKKKFQFFFLFFQHWNNNIDKYTKRQTDWVNIEYSIEHHKNINIQRIWFSNRVKWKKSYDKTSEIFQCVDKMIVFRFIYVWQRITNVRFFRH